VGAAVRPRRSGDHMTLRLSIQRGLLLEACCRACVMITLTAEPILAVSSASRSPRAPVQRTNGKGLRC
jgi:hypothetical protein